MDIRGKDYLTEQEAAFYACLSIDVFRKKAKEFGILAIRVFGTTKKAYRKADIQRAIEHQAKCQHLDDVGSRGNLTGGKVANAAANR